ncbi:MAG TPA: winged helix DNA-binding domain-containing protein [Candidatus Binatia bacterium]|nr:winged helix DNA-binding domain-containing protein [Candidatus Binatia bacterium]
MTVTVSWRQALAWRMRRHYLDPLGTGPVEDVVRRLCGVQAQVASSAELAIETRLRRPKPGAVAAAIAEGRLIKTWAMRGSLHLITPEEGGAFLSLMASGRTWERPSWVRYFGVTPPVMEALRETVRGALDGRTLTRDELIAAVAAEPALVDVAAGLASGWGTLLKPLAWQGDLCFGPSRGNRVTFMRPEAASPRWAGVPDPEEAAPIAILSYVGAYGPTTASSFGAWLAAGWSRKRQLVGWFDGLRDRMAEVDVEGERSFVLAEHLDELMASRPSRAVRLLGGFDQYVLGAGTDDEHIVAAERRAAVSRTAGWISPVVLVDGRVGGTWRLDGSALVIDWFPETERPPAAVLDAELARVGAILDDHDPAIRVGAPNRSTVDEGGATG